jgi:hypothetical protein
MSPSSYERSHLTVCCGTIYAMRTAMILLVILLPAIVSARDMGFTDLWVIQRDRVPGAEQLLAATLQGLTCENKDSRIWLGLPGGYEILLDQMKKDGVRIQEADSVWDLVRKFKPQIKGMIVCKIGTDSLNVATSLCGPKSCVAVDESLLAQAKNEGLAIVEDVRGMDDRTALAKYKSLFSRGIVVSQGAGIPGHLRDLAVARHAYTCGTDPAIVQEAAEALGPNALVYGWGREHQWVTGISRANATAVPADYAFDLSVASKLPARKLVRPKEQPVKTEDDVRYIAFVMSDGDNLQWFCGGFFHGSNYWSSPLRGTFPMTWEVPVTAAETAPGLIGHVYSTANLLDGFVTGAGLPGYTYAHLQPDRLALAKESSRYLRLADLNIAGVINDNAGSMEEVIPLLELPEVDAVLYKDYNPYDGRHGAIMWHKGKPCISFKFDLRPNRQGPEKIAEEVAKMPASPTTDEGSYALVTVLAWGYADSGGPMEAVRRTIELLPENTRVVTANQLVSLMRRNFADKHE